MKEKQGRAKAAAFTDPSTVPSRQLMEGHQHVVGRGQTGLAMMSAGHELWSLGCDVNRARSMSKPRHARREPEAWKVGLHSTRSIASPAHS